MEKAIEKIVDWLPKPVIIALIAIIALGWAIKELNSYTNYSELIDNKYFVVGLVLVLVILVTYYVSAVLTIKFGSKFKQDQRGLLVAKFDADEKNFVQTHITECLKTAIFGSDDLEDVIIKKSHQFVEDIESANRLLKSTKACLCVWGVYIPPSTIHYFITSSQQFVARDMVTTFPEITPATEKIINLIKNIPPRPRNREAQIKYLQKQVTEQQKIISDKEKQIQNLRISIDDLQVSSKPARSQTLYLKQARNYEIKRRRLGLLIGTDQFLAPEIGNLPFCVHETSSLAKTLTEIWGDTVFTKVLLNSDAVGVSITKALDEILSESREGDQILFYFNGHIVKDAAGATYILPYEANPRNIHATSIPIRTISRWASKLTSNQLVMMIDGCYSGAFAELTTKKGRSVKLSQSGQIVITSSRSNEYAFLDNNLGGSLFSYYLLDGMRGKADADNDGLISAMELYNYIQKSIEAHSKDRNINQHPAISMQGVDGEIIVSMRK